MAESPDNSLGISQKQLDALTKFRQRMEDVVPKADDQYLLRWLRARSFDLDKSEDMLRKWREKYNVDTVVETFKPPEVLVKYFPGGPVGNDKEGAPVWISPAGYLDMKGITLSAKRSDIIMYVIQQMETMKRRADEQSKKLGRHIGKAVLIDDFEGFTLKKLFQPGMDINLKVLSIVEANYPEFLKICYVVNAPRWWSLIYNFCKPFLSEDTKNKILLVGDGWKEKLLQEIDADQLPSKWGGTMPGSPTEGICMGGDVPPSFFLREQTLIDPSKWSHFTLAAGSKIDVPILIDKPFVLLKWLCKTEHHDISFGLTFVRTAPAQSSEPSTPVQPTANRLTRSRSQDEHAVATQSAEVPLVPMARINCHIVPEDGFIQCHEAGTYVFHFCNQHSWMTSKSVYYYIEVAPLNQTSVTRNSIRTGTAADDTKQ